MWLTPIVFALAAVGIAQAPPAKPDEIVAAIKTHFETVKAELSRYSGLAIYGETISGTAISKEQLAHEVELFNAAMAAGLMKAPPPEVEFLGHNLIVHDAASGVAFLKAFHEQADLSNKSVGKTVMASTIAAGEAGEKLAVSELSSTDKERRAFWAHYLEQGAIYASSVEPIQKRIAEEPEVAIKAALIRALSVIGSPSSIAFVKDLVDHATDDSVQAAALFTYVELAGFDGIDYLKGVKPVGPKATSERDEGLSWLKAETSKDSKHGREVGNDPEFASRFGDLKTSPIVQWMNKEHLLDESAVETPPKLSADKKKELLDLLVDSKGFGLEAVKGTLFPILTAQDEAALLRVRAVIYYSPSAMSSKRLKSIGLLIRQIRQKD